MGSDWKERLQQLERLQPSTDMQDKIGRRTVHSPKIGFRRGRAISVAGAALLVGATLLYFVTGRGETSLATNPRGALGDSSSSSSGLLLTSDAPCQGRGDESTLAEAEAASLPYQIFVPQDALADTTSMTLWRCPGTGIEMRFTSGIKILLDQNGIKDPAAAWKTLAAHDAVDTSVDTVLGQPAAVIDPAKSPGGQALGSVTFVDNNTWIVVVGTGKIPVDSLLRVANSLRAD